MTVYSYVTMWGCQKIVKYINSIYIPYILSTKCVKLHHVMINFKIKDKLTESIFSDQLQEAILYFLRIAW